jgi:hypothetical protein
MPRLVSLFAFLALAPAAAGQTPGVALRLDQRVLEPGEAVDVQLVCTNTGEPETPSCAEPAGLNLELLNATPGRFEQTSIINGRRFSKLEYTYSLRLTAITEGTHILGPISVVAGNTTYETEPIEITVKKSDAAALPKGDSLVWVEVGASPRSLYVTESYVATLRIGIRKVIHRNRSAFNASELLNAVLDKRRSQFSIFAQGEVAHSDTYLRDASGQPHGYMLYVIRMEVRAEKPGQDLVGPIFVRANYPTELSRGFFGRFEVSRARNVTARAEAIPVQVKAPPEEGRPEDFTGAIGQFSMRVSARPTRVEKGQPVTLAVEIRGEAVDGVAGPDLSLQPELESRFDHTTDELVGDVEGGAKVFRRAVFPKQEGEQTIPPIRWSYFDTQKEAYVTLTSDPIDIVVDPPSGNASAIALAETEPAAGNGANPLTVIPGGLSPNYVDKALVLANQRFTLTPTYIAGLVAAPLLYLGVTLIARRRERLVMDKGFARRRRASRLAAERLNKALRASSAGERFYGAGQALTGYVSDRFDRPPGHLTPAEVRSILLEHGAGGEAVDEITTFLESCEAARYAAEAAGAFSAKEAADNVRRWIKRIERETR